MEEHLCIPPPPPHPDSQRTLASHRIPRLSHCERRHIAAGVGDTAVPGSLPCRGCLCGLRHAWYAASAVLCKAARSSGEGI